HKAAINLFNLAALWNQHLKRKKIQNHLYLSHRFMSVHMFLSDEHTGGELVFPIADNETFHWQVRH
ncbi:MAG: hypothetical protein AAFY76_23705, partial [Cyanobacteria bacterium J06649_11]